VSARSLRFIGLFRQILGLGLFLISLAACSAAPSQTITPNPQPEFSAVPGTSTPAPWIVYANPVYGLEMDVPEDWVRMDIPPVDGNAGSVRFDSRTGSLHLFFMWQEDNLTINLERGAGRFEPEGTVQVNGISLPRQVLSREGQPMAVYYNGGAAIPLGDLRITVILIGRDDQPLDDLIQQVADDVVESIRRIPVMPTPTLASLQPGLEKLDVSLRQGACLDLDIGQTGGEGCDFIILENLAGEENSIVFVPIPPAMFGYDAPLEGLPLLVDCENRMSAFRSDAIVLRKDQAARWCYQTGSGALGYLQVDEISRAGISLDFLTSSHSVAVVTVDTDLLAAQYLMDVTIPDGSYIQVGSKFTKTWRLLNSGLQPWMPNFSLVFDGGENLAPGTSFGLGQTVPPGGTVDISVEMFAPGQPGWYVSYWKLQSSTGERFGIGRYGSEPFYVIIEAVEQVPTPVVGTPDVFWGNLKVMDVDLAAPLADYEGSCPMTLDLAGLIQTDGVGAFTYALEAESETPNFQFILPPEVIASNSTWGLQRLDVTFSLDIASSVEGWIHLHVVSRMGSMDSPDIPIRIRCR